MAVQTVTQIHKITFYIRVIWLLLLCKYMRASWSIKGNTIDDLTNNKLCGYPSSEVSEGLNPMLWLMMLSIPFRINVGNCLHCCWTTNWV